LIASSAEADAKRGAALEAAEAAGSDALVASQPATVRWLLCGRGRPVDAASAEAAYTVLLHREGAFVLTPNIEAPRVAAEERFDEIGYEIVGYPWHEGPARTIAELSGSRAISDRVLDHALAPLRLTLADPERDRYRAAGSDLADAVVEVVRRLSPKLRETDVAALLAREAHARGFFPPVVLVAGEERQPVHRHPLPTGAELGRHALLAVTAERDGLHVSLTRLVSFGRPPERLAALVRATAEVDAVALSASRPGRTLGDVFGEVAFAYEEHGFPEEWRHHHQGGLTGYRGREVFAVPEEATTIPESAAVAWNPSITGGGKSEDTALVSRGGVDVITRTEQLAETTINGLVRPAITSL
jgi:Xaa-Pro dipeptidase